MAEPCLLTPELWLTWIRKEVDLCSDNRAKLRVLELFERAVEEYVSVDIWLEYCQFVLGLTKVVGYGRTRDVLETACNKVGLHVQKGSLIFGVWRKSELEMYRDLPNDHKEKEKRRQSVLSLFKRELSVPLLGMQETLKDMKTLFPEAVEDEVTLMYQKAWTKLEAISGFEQKLCDIPLLTFADYEEYLDYEIREGDPARIQMLFERAVTDDCRNAELWKKYLKYMDLTLGIDSLALSVHERSIRNVPQSSSLWVSYLTCLEKMCTPTEKVEKLLKEASQQAASSEADALQLWTFHLSYIRRKINVEKPHAELVNQLRSQFEAAEAALKKYNHRGKKDQTEALLHYWATVEANLGNTQRARELWEKITSLGASTQAKTWLNYAKFEKASGNFENYRRVLHRGLFAALDRPEQIGEEWVQVEQQEGTLEGLREAQSKFESRMLAVKKERQAAHTEDVSESDAKEHIGPKGEKAPESSPEGTDKSHKAAITAHDTLDKAQIVFLSNLAYGVREEKILDLFKEAGRIRELRLVRDNKRRCKGFGYLVFFDPETVEVALKMDRAPIDGRPVFVSRCNQRKQFEYSLGLEKNKIFVKNIPLDATKEELEGIFGECGELSDVRLCVLRSGKFKGIAYADYADENSAAAAVVKLNGSELRGKRLYVAISDPPTHQKKIQSRPSKSKSRESTMRLKLFVPRSARSQSAMSEERPAALSNNGSTALRNNDYFRKLFFQK